MNAPEFWFTVFEKLSQAWPDPETELQFTNPYTLLVAVVLSAQSTDKGVNKATKTLFEKISTPQEMVELGETGLIPYVRSIGLYATKAKHIIALSERLIEFYQGQVPTDFQDLLTLPGVGRKTANVVLNVAFNRETFPVDTHVFRICRRLGAPGETPHQIEDFLEKNVPGPWRTQAHHLLILHGRYICKSRKPLCEKCVLNTVCPNADFT